MFPAVPRRLVIGADLFAAILAHLQAATPAEGVGLLAATDAGDGSTAELVRFYPGTNVDASATRYTMDPVEVLAAFGEIEANGRRFGAIVHSHPRTPPEPSPTDLREAHYPDALLLIVGLGTEPPVARAWRVVEGSNGVRVATEVPLAVKASPVAGDGDGWGGGG